MTVEHNENRQHDDADHSDTGGDDNKRGILDKDIEYDRNARVQDHEACGVGSDH